MTSVFLLSPCALLKHLHDFSSLVNYLLIDVSSKYYTLMNVQVLPCSETGKKKHPRVVKCGRGKKQCTEPAPAIWNKKRNPHFECLNNTHMQKGLDMTFCGWSLWWMIVNESSVLSWVVWISRYMCVRNMSLSLWYACVKFKDRGRRRRWRSCEFIPLDQE